MYILVLFFICYLIIEEKENPALLKPTKLRDSVNLCKFVKDTTLMNFKHVNMFKPKRRLVEGFRMARQIVDFKDPIYVYNKLSKHKKDLALTLQWKLGFNY